MDDCAATTAVNSTAVDTKEKIMSRFECCINGVVVSKGWVLSLAAGWLI
jgi:hypothetical protein